MAPTLAGAGAAMTCPNCNAKFRVGVDQWPAERALARCVQCGHRFNVPVIGEALSGSRVCVDRWSNQAAGFERWQTVVFRCPEDARTLCIKRIVALPGESIDFAEGDIWIDGRRVIKSLGEQLAVRVAVHRESNELQYWRGDDCTYANDEWKLAGTASAARLRFTPPLGHVTDDLAANQSLRHRTQRVDDLMFSCQVRLAEDASLQLSIAGQDTSAIKGPIDARMLWSTFDHRLLLAIDDQIVWQLDWPNAWRPEDIEIVARNGMATLEDLTLYRDIHYTWRAGDLRPAANWRLSPDEYFVIGDNQSLSYDSRNWPHKAGLPGRLVLGSAIAPSSP